MLTTEAVIKVLKSCMFQVDEPHDNEVIIKGIVHDYAFHSERLKLHAAIIDLMLAELPEQFHEGIGGGWPFMNACNDKHGNQWTNLHLIMEGLFCLGIGVSKAKWLFPRETWNIFPGGVPYVVVLKDKT